MIKIDKRFILDITPKSKYEAMVVGEKYRITVLTPQMVRLEYSECGKFEDRATQIVLNRDFPVPEFRVIEEDDNIEIITESIHIIYDKKPFSKNGLRIELKGGISFHHNIWYFGTQSDNLKGTARTLDEANGMIPLEDGLLSRNGFSIIDDSKSLVLEEGGWVSPRKHENIDIYYLGYGRDYLSCLKDFYMLSGPTPMLPRFALGNWWSRFYPYSEKEYKSLFKKFKTENIPFSVAVIDMDWHLNDIDPKYGSGWTGYTWNRDLFPDPGEFLAWLKKEGVHTTLNVHPADGVRAFEEMYEEMAKELNVDYENEDKIHFDITDPKFLEAYFKYLHHPNEDIGVDFWWIDWQQGSHTKIKGLDPLWMLNHYHFLDNGRNKNQALILSRYAGLGSHRYPIGFSGDTYATWESLDFQPYFTATASNAGYGWWSHDIGGHMHGEKNDEMAIRWLQFGVFSPIMRIHSSGNRFFRKEPWQFNPIVEKSMKNFLSLRHQLVPYLYTMNRKFHKDGEPLIQPMYYRHPEDGEAYGVPNQYYFGQSIIVCPITKPMVPKLMLGKFKAWLPKGLYFDFFVGRSYRGDRRIDLYRDINTIPVLVKAGSIIPMTKKDFVENSVENPVNMEIRVFAGANGLFELYEDNSWNNSIDNIREAITSFEFIWQENASLIIRGYQGDKNVVPEKRNYTIKFIGFKNTEDIRVSCNETQVFCEKTYIKELNTIKMEVESVNTCDDIKVIIPTKCEIAENNVREQVFALLDKAQIEYDLKSLILRAVEKHEDKILLLGELQAMDLEEDLRNSLFEIITAFVK